MDDEGVDVAISGWFVGCDYLQTFMRACCVGPVFGLGLVREHLFYVGAFNSKPFR